MRREAYKLAARFQAGYACLWVDAPLELALARNAARSDGDGNGTGVRVEDETIRRMTERLEPPNPGAHRWEGNFVRVEAEGDVEITRAAVLACVGAGWRAPGKMRWAAMALRVFVSHFVHDRRPPTLPMLACLPTCPPLSHHPAGR